MTPPIDAQIVAKAAPEILPEGYHVEHFLNVIKGVESCYSTMMSFEERLYLKKIGRLSPDALNLYIRLANRKGPYFLRKKLAYLAPSRLATALNELTIENLAVDVQPGVDDMRSLLDTYSCAQLYEMLCPHGAKKTMRKGDFCDWLLSLENHADILAEILRREPLIMLLPSPWKFLKFLYFGKLVDNLSDFVIHDLGHVASEEIDPASITGLFSTRKMADDAYKMHLIYEEFRTIRDVQEPLQVLAWWKEKEIDRDALDDAAHNIHDRLICGLGRILERGKHIVEAIEIYNDAPCGAAQERLIRLLIKLKHHDKALEQCRIALAQNCNAEERFIILRLLEKLQAKNTKHASHVLLKQFPATPVAWKDEIVEEAALSHYRQQGWDGVHSENWLWNNLFGLFFWDIIHDKAHGRYHNILQIAPQGLFQPGFFAARQEMINARLEMLQDCEAAYRHLEKYCGEKHGLSNPFVSWREDSMAQARFFYARIGCRALAAIFRKMTEDLGTWCHGFPDLFLWKEDAYLFAEVKSPTDRLQPQQHNWLDYFRAEDINFEIFRPVRMVAA